MIVTPESLAAVTQGFQRLYSEALLAAPSSLERFCAITGSQHSSETFKWLGNVPALRRWTDQRVKAGLPPYELTITNEKYETSIEVDRETLEDDQLGLVRPRVEQMGHRTAEFPETIIYPLLNAGFSTECYDEQYFFDTDHQEGDSGVQSNKTTDALTGGKTGSLATAIMTMKAYKDDQGEPLNVSPDLLVVGPENEFNAREILKSTEIVITGSTDAERGKANVLENILDLVVNPRVDTNNWYVLDTKKPFKPLLWQWRVKPEFSGVTNPNDAYVFETDAFKWGVRARAGAGFLMWQLAYGAQVA